MQMTIADLRQALHAEREAAFFRLRGGYPIPLAGGLWWAMLGLLGFRVSHGLWILLTFYLTGLLFPLAILVARLCRIDFLRDRTAVSDVAFPAMGSMLLFWPMAMAAYRSYPMLVPLILAIGLSIMWPVIGWSYGRTALFVAHAVVRAVVCLAIWMWLPSWRFTGLPLAVSAMYLVTVAIIFYISAPQFAARAKLAS